MEIIKAKSIFKAYAIGPIHFMQPVQKLCEKHCVVDVEAECERFISCRDLALTQLAELYEKAVVETGEESAQIFEVHQMLLQDDDFCDPVLDLIRETRVNAEYALAEAGAELVATFEAMSDPYFRERAADMRDITQRVQKCLSGAEDHEVDTPSIIVADDLTPSETIRLGRKMLLAFVTKQGSANSHAAILARTMSIPAFFGVDIKEEWNGRMAIVDGVKGELILDPDPELAERYQELLAQDRKRREELLSLIGKEDITLDGRKVEIAANIGNVADCTLAVENDAQAVGLFRSEFLYLGRENLPDEETQFQAYREVAVQMKGKRVVIRSLDIGADKQLDYLDLPKEQNPALGRRAIRLCLQETELFRTQLRAILRAAHFGKIALMFPMITAVSEIRRAKEQLDIARAELTARQVPFGSLEVGIMIETPAAAIIADILAAEVDFFSIGTNDLTQYSLALDRQNESLEEFVDSHHPAILRLIQQVVDAGHAAGIWVGICGELAADPELTEFFLRRGVDELSMSPGMILPTRRKIRGLDLSK